MSDQRQRSSPPHMMGGMPPMPPMPAMPPTTGMLCPIQSDKMGSRQNIDRHIREAIKNNATGDPQGA